MSELVSVCIPTYNQAQFIGETIGSVLVQTYPHFELIIVDNASTDNTAEVVASFSDPRIQYARNATNIGMAPNWNRCLDLARGRYVAILSSDDLYQPTFLEKSMGLIAAHPDVHFTHTGSYFIDAGGKLLGVSAPPGPQLQDGNSIFREFWSERQLKNPVYFLSIVYHRQRLMEIGGFSAELKAVADLWSWLLLAIDGVVGYIPEPLTSYRMHSGSVTGQMLRTHAILDDRLRLADLVFTHPLVAGKPELMSYKQYAPASSVYRSVVNLRVARRNGLVANETWQFYWKYLVPLNWRAALDPWSLYYLLIALLPQGVLNLARAMRSRLRALARVFIT
jgi:glycosyltransferase involved in cell wall biosynthesis